MSKTHFQTPAGSGYEFASLLSMYLFGHPVGNVFFVNSSTGTDSSGHGHSPDAPLATLDYAVGRCTANNDDVIVVMPGHAETISATATLTLDVAGITIIGIGKGAARPTFTFATSTAATVDIDAASVHIENLLFVNNIDGQLIVIDINAADVTVQACEFREGSAKQWATGIDVGADRCRILDCTFRSAAAGADNAIKLTAAKDGIEIRRCKVWGDFTDACIHNPTGTVCTNLTISDCELTNLQTGDHSIELVSACTGNLIRNLYHNDMTQQTGCDPGSCFSFECYHDDAIDTSGILCPAVT